jgi:DNA-binding PadR family transcriptional regulator
MAELRALAPSMSVGALDRWLDSAVARGIVEPSRAGYDKRWRLTRSGRAELDRVVIQETVDPGSTGRKP